MRSHVHTCHGEGVQWRGVHDGRGVQWEGGVKEVCDGRGVRWGRLAKGEVT